MKKLLSMLFGLACILVLVACKENTSADLSKIEGPLVPKYSVQIELDCVKNLIFSKYDIDVFIDGDKIGKLDHGATRTYSIEVEEGTHTLIVAKEGSSSVDGTIDFVVSEDAEYKYKLSCTSQQVEIEEIVDETEEIISNEAESYPSDSEEENIDISDNIKTSLRTVTCFDIGSNQELVFGGLKFSFPSNFDSIQEGATEAEICYYPSEEICYCSLVFMSEDVNLSEKDFNTYKSQLADNYLKLVRENENLEITSVTSEEITVAGLSGWTVSYIALQPDNDQSMVNYTFVFNPDGNRIVSVLQTYGSNDESSYDYVGDYNRILQNAILVNSPDNQTSTGAAADGSNEESSNDVQTSNLLSYSTNDRETAKKGNTGVFSYVKSGKSYDIYWIIDFDEGYVYWFTEGNGNTECDRVAIESGDLNSVMIITYHDGGDEWSYGLHFKWKNMPDILIMQDNDGFEYKFTPTNLESALKLRDSKTIKDY